MKILFEIILFVIALLAVFACAWRKPRCYDIPPKKLACLLFILHCMAPPRAQAQATSMVVPRQYVLFNNFPLAASQTLSTNTNSAVPSLTNMLAATQNTLTPMVSAHPVGLTLTVYNTNNGSVQWATHTSNLVVTVYAADDTNGPSPGGLLSRGGTNFTAANGAAINPILTWTCGYEATNGVNATPFATTFETNLSTAQWEPATTLGFIISNTVSSNISFTLTVSQAP